MPITNAYMAEWAGEYQWTTEGIPIDVYARVEDNLAAIPALEGSHLTHFRAGGRAIALLTCRVPRPASLPGRPGVAYHHALIADEHINPASLEQALRVKYRNPVEFTHELYDRIAQETRLDHTARDIIAAVRRNLDSVMVHSLAPSPSDPVPSSDKAILHLLRLNAALMAIVIGLGLYQTVLLHRVLSKDANGGDTSMPQPGDTANDRDTSVAPPAPPTPQTDDFQRILQGGDAFILDTLPSGPAFVDNPRTQELIADIQRFFAKNRNWRVSVEVYTDLQGSEAANQQTSTARANLLEERIRSGGGAGMDRLTVTGRGEAPTPSPPGKPPITSRERRIVVTALPPP
jgi:outer membrane protein OmpA-like peptidoglycan-associated protein